MLESLGARVMRTRSSDEEGIGGLTTPGPAARGTTA